MTGRWEPDRSGATDRSDRPDRPRRGEMTGPIVLTDRTDHAGGTARGGPGRPRAPHVVGRPAAWGPGVRARDVMGEARRP
ncbi:hypothetical protein SCATT_36420 [Streptantibioticus cattleyicolor NRRL 8057 = DSM 46488]|uniref:Uncharacterized protein n=1 Tax=Streptantibioticus cattleyicolor (strain ATCC 35852 / DSM 46488 / JCM 4925 / NBRC 14057 / NRRL 8057) TaxID=1003195 RepID=F8JZD3_STREN|nr:hypothetical protein SCATT_36420 [Streptantibioticus cattleyicolor NRRL 8057 = DSM 46488]MYS60545.1 hypothetical protein [Streptomyces sp. SID5468]CCB76346.1 protein of unknown function [Streptantibioticus cattleyicolor NRRL 8057 = DSM 46488]